MEAAEKTLSEKIRDCRDGVVKNPFQGTDKKVVFVCSMGILRSATAARIYGHK
jgi:rhodanese-related sulfurtransferase